MRDKETGLTPKQAAVDIAAGWMIAAARKSTGDLDKYDNERFQMQVRKQLILMHNKLANSPAGQEAGLMEWEV